MERKFKPNWWLLYLTVPLMIGLLFLEGHLQASPQVHRIMEFGIVVIGFGLMAMWVRANEGALVNEEMDRERWMLVPPSDGTADEFDPDGGVPQLRVNALGEFDMTSETGIDPDSLPRVDEEDDSEEHPYYFRVSPTKGRYN